MGLLSRRQPRAEVVNPGVPLVSRREKGTSGYAHSAAGQYDHGAGHLNGRPSFGQWIRATWLDLLTMVAMSAIALGVKSSPSPNLALWSNTDMILGLPCEAGPSALLRCLLSGWRDCVP